MSEFSPRPPWQLPAAVLAALGMVVAATHFRGEIENKDTSSSLPSTTSMPASVAPSSTTTTGPEFIGPAQRLESGFLVDDRGLRFDTKMSRGVDCQPSYKHTDTEHAPGYNEFKVPLGLVANPSLLGKSRNIVFLGEETSEPRLDNYKLSDGWAMEKNTDSDDYIIYKFRVNPTGSLRAEAIGQPIKKLASAALRNEIYEVQDDTMVFTAQILADAANPGQEHMQLTIKCRQDER